LKERILITGGAGFIGAHLAHRFLSAGRAVLLFDNLSRPGVERNLRWLRETHGDLAQVEVADVRNSQALARAVRRASQVFHFAARVAVTTSLISHIHDFEVNARGALNLLEALRGMNAPPPLVFTSTNKVYGNLDGSTLIGNGSRYEPEQGSILANGVSEEQALDFQVLDLDCGAVAQLACSWKLAAGRDAIIEATFFGSRGGVKFRNVNGSFYEFINVHPLGRLPFSTLASWLSRASIYALPARYEPFGLSALEAGMPGCALVLGDLPSLREVWGKAALFVPPDDSEALKAAIENLIKDDAARKALAARARERALQYTTRRMARGYLRAYSDLLAGATEVREEAACAL
jgi:hypothetical protein